MADVDFQELLDVDASEALKPPAMPGGTYRCFIEKHALVRSQQKNTPGAAFTLTKFEPMSDVDSDAWAAYANHPMIDVSKLTRVETFWMTRKSLYRVKEFSAMAQRVDPSELSGKMGKIIADAEGNTVLVKIVQSVSQRGGVFNEIQEFAADDS